MIAYELRTGYFGEKNWAQLLYLLADGVGSLLEAYHLLPDLQLLVLRVLFLEFLLLFNYQFLEECPRRPALED